MVNTAQQRRTAAKIRSKWRMRAWILVFLAPWIIGFTAFTVIPMATSLYYSFTSYSLGAPPQWIGAANWVAMVHDPLMWRSLWNSLYYTLGSVPLQLALALVIALLVNVKGIPGRGMFRTFFYLPTVVPTVAASILWIALFNPYGGLINDALGALHIPQPLWLESPTWAMPALILMSLWGIGTTMVIYLAGLQDIPRQLYEQAMVDGASPVRMFVHITIPMLSPIILFNGIMDLIWSMQTFTQPYLMTKGGPMDATLLFPLYVFQNAFEYLNMGYASALAWLLFLIVMGLTLLTIWLSRRSVFYQ
ncbi:MAG: sugar ABC transporter permease [Firmicutes bacterium]|nr:sugar ABC transporter permease [Bacillota bacterium]